VRNTLSWRFQHSTSLRRDWSFGPEEGVPTLCRQILNIKCFPIPSARRASAGMRQQALDFLAAPGGRIPTLSAYADQMGVPFPPAIGSPSTCWSRRSAATSAGSHEIDGNVIPRRASSVSRRGCTKRHGHDHLQIPSHYSGFRPSRPLRPDQKCSAAPVVASARGPAARLDGPSTATHATAARAGGASPVPQLSGVED
jgi:hypothetical protein